MGLDMYLYAQHKEATEINDDGELQPVIVKIGQWRKHPNLHSYIEKEVWPKDPDYEEQKDRDFNCIPVQLSKEDLLIIKRLSQEAHLPKSEGGFFFGESYPEHNEETVKIMNDAIEKIDTDKWNIYYDSWW